MYPHNLDVFGLALPVWNATFLVAIALAYLVFRPMARAQRDLSAATPRFLVVVYLSAIAAQVFAYAFDAHTSLLPPPGRSARSYYLDPLAGPKTLYGVIVLMPLSAAVATTGCRIPLARALDLWTVPMLVVLATVRVGCFLQGCCHGPRSDVFGVAFPVGAPVYWTQRGEGLIADGASWALPVIPTQALESAALAALALSTWKRSRAGHRAGELFLPAVLAYSVFRFAVEFVRADPERGIYGPLATSQWIAILVFAASLLVMRRNAATKHEPAAVRSHGAAAVVEPR